MRPTGYLLITLCLLLTSSCFEKKAASKTPVVDDRLAKAEQQLSLQLDRALLAGRIPRTISEEGELQWTGQQYDWTEGFFPGSCWYLYEVTKDEKWRKGAERLQANYERHKSLTTKHDLGFIFNCSYGNGYRLTDNEYFMGVLRNAGDSLMTRFNPTVGSIQSWDTNRGWMASRGWEFPVIIDNMMNLELLFELSRLTGEDKYAEVAKTHANTTMKNHFRPDYSSFHVVDYDPTDGTIRSKETAQGFADSSSWARGQAWGLYGFTVCYKHTGDKVYLDHARKIADYIIANLPEDGVPYWDYDAPRSADTPRDASAAAITASALVELNAYTAGVYADELKMILNSLASPAYTAEIGKNQHFILKHSVGSIPHGNEIDVPINYADYYYLEALVRYQKSMAAGSMAVRP